MNSHEPQLMSVVTVGQDLIDEQQFGAEKVQGRLEEIMNLWQNLKDLSDYRKRRLTEAVDYHQVIAHNAYNLSVVR
jgi:spectrin beta